MDRAGLAYWLAVPAAGLVSLAAGYLFGRPALRLEGLYLALATFALGVAMPQLLKYRHLEAWTGGVGGIVLTSPRRPGACRWMPTSGSTSMHWPWRRCCSGWRATS